MILIGYSGHSYVAAGIVRSMGKRVSGYCDVEEKQFNPLGLLYLGTEDDAAAAGNIDNKNFFISIGDNLLRRRVALKLEKDFKFPATIFHSSAVIDETASISDAGVMVAAGVCVNPLARIGKGAILNTSCVIEHECVVGEFAHIGPGTILCGNVTVGDNSFVGAGAVVKQNVTIGKNAIVGAGAVVIRDVDDDGCVVGNPAESKIKNKA